VKNLLRTTEAVLAKFINMFINLTMNTNIHYLKSHLCLAVLLNFPLLLMNMKNRGGSRILGDWFLIKGIAGFKVKTKKKNIGKNQKVDISEWLDVVH